MRADLEVTRSVDEQIGGLEVTVQHVGGVNVLEASQDLVEEIADVVIAQPLALQQLVQVCLHQSLHNVAERTRGSRTTTGQYLRGVFKFLLHSTATQVAESNFIFHVYSFA